MSEKVESLFSDADRAAIAEATARAEAGTTAEIVCVLTDSSDDYPEANWIGACAGAVLFGATAPFVSAAVNDWNVDHGAIALSLITVGGLLGTLLVRSISALRRWAIGSGRLGERVQSHAMQAFTEEQVFNTRERTGLLLFISVFEHRVAIIADEGIHRRAPLGTWDALIEIDRRD
ncbi:MAG: hypothetical protein R3A47_12030 [Polyangiales bacterium]